MLSLFKYYLKQHNPSISCHEWPYGLLCSLNFVRYQFLPEASPGSMGSKLVRRPKNCWLIKPLPFRCLKSKKEG